MDADIFGLWIAELSRIPAVRPDSGGYNIDSAMLSRVRESVAVRGVIATAKLMNDARRKDIKAFFGDDHIKAYCALAVGLNVLGASITAGE